MNCSINNVPLLKGQSLFLLALCRFILLLRTMNIKLHQITTLLLGLFSLSVSLLANSAEKSILVIESYHAEHEWDRSYIAGLQESLGRGYQLHSFQMDTKRLPPHTHAMRAEAAWDTYKKMRPDLVVLGDDNALRLLGPRFAHTATPVVYLGINRNPRDYGVVNADNITGVLERPLLKRSVLLLNEIIDVKRVLVLFDTSTTSKAVKSEYFYNQTSMKIRNVEVDVVCLSSFEQWQKIVSNAKQKGYDALVVGLYHTLVDSLGQYVDADRVVKWTSANTSIPPFGFWDFSVGKHKTIGGYVLYGKEQGLLAGQLARKILEGQLAAPLPPQTGLSGQFLFSRSQLEKWHITHSLTQRVDAEYIE